MKKQYLIMFYKGTPIISTKKRRIPILNPSSFSKKKFKYYDIHKLFNDFYQLYINIIDFNIK